MYTKITLNDHAKATVPTSIRDAEALYLVKDCGNGTSFIGAKRYDGTLGICTHVATADIIME